MILSYTFCRLRRRARWPTRSLASSLSLALLAMSLLACSEPAPTCPETECPEPECPPAGLAVEPWEEALLAPVLADVRAGVTLHGEEFGVCRGRSKCDAFLGAEPEPLTKGAHMVRADVRAPAAGEDWQVRFEVTCEKAEGPETIHEKVYPVKYTGKSRGFRLQPLWTIQSPHPSGARDCRYALTPLRGDVPTGEPWTGRYQTPAEE